MRQFTWTAKRERAALLVAQDTHSDVQIAAELGVTTRALRYWKSRPEFQVRVREHRDARRELDCSEGIADRRARVAALDDCWRRILRLIEARAVAYKDVVPGGNTGLLVREPMLRKVYNTVEGEELIPTGRTEIVDVYRFDAAVIRELRALGKQAALELGQWGDKAPVEGGVFIREYVGISVEDV